MRKNIFVDGHEQSDIIENHKNSLQKMEELKPYIVEFEENGIMKLKIYPSYCAIGGNNWWPIIVITHDEYILSVNNKI